MRLIDRFVPGAVADSRATDVTQLAQLFADDKESLLTDFTTYVAEGLKGSGPVYSLIAIRVWALSEVTFKWRNRGDKKLFGNEALRRLERPWPNGTTGDLVAKIEIDLSLAGNAYIRKLPDRLARLRPDWVDIIVGEDEMRMPTLLGYQYWPDGRANGRPVSLVPEDVAHFTELPDPSKHFGGMSWITPVAREVDADSGMSKYKDKFFTNAAPQPLDAKVLTSRGWSTMGALSVGGDVIGSDGLPHDVTGVYPQGTQDVYRVTFLDGAATECTSDHLWTVANAYDRKRGVTRTKSLAELVEAGIRYESGPYKWAVPLPEPVQFESSGELPVDPYLMGLLLGDGSFRSNGKGSGGVTLAVAAEDTDETIERLVLPSDVSITRRDRGGWSELYFKGPGGPNTNPLTQRIRDLGLFDTPGRDKSIPAEYMTASIKDRVALLQGLIDSDGHIAQTGVRFTTASRALADGVQDLVGSLGGVATVKPNRGRSTLTVNVRQLPDWIVPAQLLRKAAAYRPFNRSRWRTIGSVERVRRVETQCIRVDTADHLYVTDGYVLTHNTPNLKLKIEKTLDPDVRQRLLDQFRARHEGIENAYKTIVVEGGADVEALGHTFEQITFSTVQSAGETRLAAAAGVPPVVVGFLQGIQAATYSNYSQAMRRYGDLTCRPKWRNLAGVLENIVPPPNGAQLWYDDRDIPFLQQDAKDEAEIRQVNANTLESLIRAGYTAESAALFIESGDASVLVHSGLVSVQLQLPGTTDPSPDSDA